MSVFIRISSKTNIFNSYIQQSRARYTLYTDKIRSERLIMVYICIYLQSLLPTP